MEYLSCLIKGLVVANSDKPPGVVGADRERHIWSIRWEQQPVNDAIMLHRTSEQKRWNHGMHHSWATREEP